MKKHDIFMLFALFLLILLLILPVTSSRFFGFSQRYVLLGGFMKFFLFASIGDVISHRLKTGSYRVKGLFYKAIVWGFIGVVIVFIFTIFSEGVASLQAQNILPFAGSLFAFAFFTSLFMNLFFAPTMMLFHRITDHYIEGKVERSTHRLYETIKTVDYHGFVTFVLFKTIPLFWIPAHTVTFLLSPQYRVFFASLLGIALGLLLGIGKRLEVKEDC